MQTTSDDKFTIQLPVLQPHNGDLVMGIQANITAAQLNLLAQDDPKIADRLYERRVENA